MLEIPTKKEFLDFFFEASLNGWAGGAPEVTLPELPGFKVINYPKDGQPNMKGWFYRDAYSVNKETKISTGFTNIWNNGVHLFTAGYGGHYPKYTIPFLKESLRNAYNQKVFFGGRGVWYRDNQFEYTIRIPELDNIGTTEPLVDWLAKIILKQTEPINFSGLETIRNLDQDRVVGWHTCWCMTLF